MPAPTSWASPLLWVAGLVAAAVALPLVRAECVRREAALQGDDLPYEEMPPEMWEPAVVTEMGAGAK